MNEIISKNLEIKDLIYEIRGVQVMLDSDLAKLYGVETKRINEAVKNNFEKFPERYYFKLTKEECLFSRSKISTLNKKVERGHNIKYLPSAFTEQGIYMLATILKSEKATQVTLNIMDTFVMMRHFIGNNLIEQRNINNMVLKHDNDIKELQDTFINLLKQKRIIKYFLMDKYMMLTLYYRIYLIKQKMK